MSGPLVLRSRIACSSIESRSDLEDIMNMTSNARSLLNRFAIMFDSIVRGLPLRTKQYAGPQSRKRQTSRARSIRSAAKALASES